jgi:hypothetical protein
MHGYRLVDAIAARVPASALPSITASPGVASVIPDGPIVGPEDSASAASLPATKTTPGAVKTTPGAVKTPPGACSATPMLTPEALSLTGADSTAKGAQTARSLGFTGAGVKVAFLADGIDTSNANLMRGGKPVIGDYKDFSGDGTDGATDGGEAFLDANAVAGQGSQVYNVAGFGGQAPSSPCRIKIEGTAPGVSLVALKVFSHSNVSTTSGFLQAIDYAVNVDHVNVINESFGANPFPDVTSMDAVKEFNDLAVRAGTTVVVASGDAGPFNTIGSPASDPQVISVGASTDFQFYAQTNYAGADQFAPNGWESDNISSRARRRRATRPASTSSASRHRSRKAAERVSPRRLSPGWRRWSSRPTRGSIKACRRARPRSSRSCCPPRPTSGRPPPSRAPGC